MSRTFDRYGWWEQHGFNRTMALAGAIGAMDYMPIRAGDTSAAVNRWLAEEVRARRTRENKPFMGAYRKGMAKAIATLKRANRRLEEIWWEV